MKTLIIVVVILIVLGIGIWYLSLMHASDAGTWNANKAFLIECIPARTIIEVQVGFKKGEIPKTQVPEALSKLLAVRIIKYWYDAPYNDDTDLEITVTNQRGEIRHIWGWPNRPPYFSPRGRSDAGPWFARFAKKQIE